jgi:hypothetical protein
MLQIAGEVLDPWGREELGQFRVFTLRYPSLEEDSRHIRLGTDLVG